VKNVVIFGGCGFVGQHLTKSLQNKKYKVVPVDVVQKPNAVIGDIRNSKDCDKFCKDADIVIHLAGELPHAGWQKELPKGTMWKIMVDGTRNVLESCLKYKVKKIIYFSSSAVYGSPPTYPLKEDAPHRPLDEYGKAKSRAEDLCNKYMARGLNTTIIRPMTILGPNFVGILRSMMEFIYNGKTFPLIGGGKNKIQLIHIDDVVSAVIACIENPKSKNEVFNITSDMDGMPTIKEELDELCKYAKTGAKVRPVPSWVVRPVLLFTRVIGKATMGKEIYTLADKTFLTDNSKAKKLLGWKPKYGNVDALEAGYDWFSKNHEIAKPNLSLPLKIAMRLL
jgi:nucleoside-diphosphate-sugar epimerase